MPKTSDKIDLAMLREMCKMVAQTEFLPKYLTEQGHCTEQEITDRAFDIAMTMEQTHKQHYPETRKAYILDKTKSWEGCLAWYAGKIVGAQLMAEIRGDTMLQNRFHQMKSREINERMEVELTKNNEMVAELMAMIMLSQI